MIGTQVTKQEVDARVGQIAQTVNAALADVREMQGWLVAQTEGAMEAFGYTAGEVAIIKSAFPNLDQLRTIYEGSANLASPQDFRTFAQQLWGFGF